MNDNELNLNSLRQMLDEMTRNITDNISRNLEEGLNSIKAEQESNRKHTEEHHRQIGNIERELRKRNILIFGVEEGENNYWQLEDTVLEIINNILQVDCEPKEIDFVRRIGNPKNQKRPIIVGFLTFRKKLLVVKNKRLLSEYEIYIKDDFPQEVLKERKRLQPEVDRLWKEGKAAFIKYDKIVINQESNSNNESHDKINSNSDTSNVQSADKPLENRKRPASSPATKPNDRNFPSQTINKQRKTFNRQHKSDNTPKITKMFKPKQTEQTNILDNAEMSLPLSSGDKSPPSLASGSSLSRIFYRASSNN